MRGARARRLAMVAVAWLMSLGATEPPKPGSPSTGPQEAQVAAVVLDQNTRQPVVLLEGKRDRRPLAMAIGQFEANGIAIALQGGTPPRPPPHHPFLHALGAPRASLKRIVVTDLRDDVFYAQLHLETAGTRLTIDSRPSDAIALALRARVPILVEDRVFEKADRLLPKGGSPPPLCPAGRDGPGSSRALPAVEWAVQRRLDDLVGKLEPKFGDLRGRVEVIPPPGVSFAMIGGADAAKAAIRGLSHALRMPELYKRW